MGAENRITLAKAGLESIETRGFCTLRQFAAMIDVTYPTAMKMRDRKQIAPIQVGGRWRVYAGEFNRFIREGNAQTQTLVSAPAAKAQFRKDQSNAERYQIPDIVKRSVARTAEEQAVEEDDEPDPHSEEGGDDT